MADDSGFNFGDFFKQYLTNGQGGMSSFVPAMAQAWQQYNNAGQYGDIANAAAQDASPVSTTDRRYYTDRLRQSYDDPSAILNDPGHKIQVQRGLDNVSAQNAMKGYLGSGNMAVDLSKYASDSDATYLDAERQRLGNLGGFQFDPANAANIRMKGNDQEIQAKNAALAAMFTQFNNANSPQNKGGKLPIDPSTGLADLSKISDPIALLKQTFKESGAAAGPASQWIRDQLLKGGTVDPQDPHVADAINEMNQGGYLDGIDTSENNAGYGYPDQSTGQPDYGYGPGDNPDPYSSSGNNSGIWSAPENTDWGSVDYSSFNDNDWNNFADFFGISGE